MVPPPPPSLPDELVVVRFPSAHDEEGQALAAAEADITGNPIYTGPIGRLAVDLGGPRSALGSSVVPVVVPPELTNLHDLSQLPIAPRRFPGSARLRRFELRAGDNGAVPAGGVRRL